MTRNRCFQPRTKGKSGRNEIERNAQRSFQDLFWTWGKVREFVATESKGAERERRLGVGFLDVQVQGGGKGGSWCFRILRASLRKRLEGFRFLGGKGYLGASRWHDTSTNGVGPQAR